MKQSISCWGLDKKIIILILFAVFLMGCSQIVTPPPPVSNATNVTHPPETSIPISTDQSTVLPTATEAPIPSPTPYPTPMLEKVFLKGGGFNIGTSYLGEISCAPSHYINIPDFRIGAFEITNGEYQQCVDTGGCEIPKLSSSNKQENYFGNPVFNNFPVVWVTYSEAQKFCRWVGGDLPTENQWEIAGRYTTGRAFSWGDSIPLRGQANLAHSDSSYDTARVGSFPEDKTPEGVFDLVGNVSEWTSSWFMSYENSVKYFNFTDKSRVIRGGNFTDPLSYTSVRLYYRRDQQPVIASSYIGFRCVWNP